jgi:hypothetical protein
MKSIISIFLTLITCQVLCSQELCFGKNGEIFTVTEVMPESTPDLMSIDDLLNSNFSISDCEITDGDKVIIQFKLNCEGEDFDYITQTFKKDTIDCGINEFLQSQLAWTIAKQREKLVDFSGTLVFEIKDSKFSLLSSPLLGINNSKRKK